MREMNVIALLALLFATVHSQLHNWNAYNNYRVWNYGGSYNSPSYDKPRKPKLYSSNAAGGKSKKKHYGGKSRKSSHHHMFKPISRPSSGWKQPTSKPTQRKFILKPGRPTLGMSFCSAFSRFAFRSTTMF
jgi:hypothetical protein